MNSQTSNEELRQIFAELGFVTGSSANTASVLRLAHKAATVSDVAVLLEGETGTGKQVLAQAIHRLDQKRGSFSFVTVHCSTVSESLAESELFGHERGAFSGATAERRGLFKAASRGTLFLDDINDLPLNLQPKLLDVLQRGTVRAVGSDKEIQIDFRVIAAANRPLAPLVRENRFRADLYHRLNVVKLVLPPLRQRPQDLAHLIQAFAVRHAHIYPHITGVAPCLVAFLQSQSFNGNVRELEHMVERMLFLKTQGDTLDLSDWLAQSIDEAAAETEPTEAGTLLSDAANAVWKAISEFGVSYDDAIDELEKKVLQAAIRNGGQTRREIASRLCTSERTLYQKLRDLKLTKGALRASAAG
ncbi:MAG TPA: sigma 54-interacting transcriptional regulator [Bryobacteraceae bacterium]|jgi:transcriptional regulator with PAS, ATPase and Fis domain|nr:sigma 54-interacting transcriptional regulator [Bryobacteraceae bacterium]